MSEGLADANNHSTPRLETLYRRWARSGAGLLLSGNIQVDRWHLERPGNIVVDDSSGNFQLARLAEAGVADGVHFWAQLSHTGRQVDSAINASPLAPSSVEVDVLRGAGFSFAPPKAMTEDQIQRAIDQFAFAARQVRDVGFTGISMHGAHGYLISQFLSPLTNLRTDQWGGSLENRSRFLLEVLGAVREAVGHDFPIGLKLNSSDFRKGGFTNAECIELVKKLNESTLDLLELSGGSLEQPKIVGVSLKDEGEDGRRESTIKREAYFVEFAGAVRAIARMPVMVVGGFRSRAAMIESLERGELDVVGLGRPFIANPEIGHRILEGEVDVAPAPEASLDLFHLLPWNNMQLERLGDGLDPDLSLPGAVAAERFMEIETRNVNVLLERRRGMAF